MDLQAVFDKQIELNKRIKSTLYDDIKNDSELRRQWFLRFELALKQESSEAIDSLNWKWWKKDDDDWDNVKVELVDMLHFWVSMCTVAGMDATEVLQLYFKKNELNFKRQNEGYSEGTYQKVDAQGVEDNQKYVLDSQS